MGFHRRVGTPPQSLARAWWAVPPPPIHPTPTPPYKFRRTEAGEASNRRARDGAGARPDQKEQRLACPALRRFASKETGPFACGEISLRAPDYQGVRLNAHLRRSERLRLSAGRG